MQGLQQARLLLFFYLGISVDDLLEDYEQLSADVFSSPKPSFIALFHPKYDLKNLEKDLKKLLVKFGLREDILLRDLPKKIVIPSVSLDDSQSKRWKLEFHENLSPDGGNLSVVEILLKTSAAPTYFASKDGSIDGGMGMKDPSLASIMFAYNPEKSDLRKFALLSIGTGYNEKFLEGDEKWGATQWLITGSKETGRLPLLNMLMDVEEQSSAQVCAKLLGNRYRKVDFNLPKLISLDDYKHIKNLIKYTQDFILKDKVVWQENCEWVSNYFNSVNPSNN